MASKSAKKIHTICTRTSCNNKNLSVPPDKCLESSNSACELNSSHYLNPMDELNRYQLQQKMEKTSLSPRNSNYVLLHDQPLKNRRLTRSTADSYKRMPGQMELQNEQVTPEDKPITKVAEEHTLKKLNRVNSAVELGEIGGADVNLTVRKSISKISEVFVSPYSEVRKSYRKVQKRQIFSIPYRKCHDVFEGRIVFLINKLSSGKHCAKDFESFIEKMQRISVKDMMNKYVVAGIRTIVKLCKSFQSCETGMGEAIERLQQQEGNLQSRIVQELQSTVAYEGGLGMGAREEHIDCSEYRCQLIRRMYKINKRKYYQRSRKQIREITIRQCEKLFNLTTTAAKLIGLLRSQMKVPFSK